MYMAVVEDYNPIISFGEGAIIAKRQALEKVKQMELEYNGHIINSSWDQITEYYGGYCIEIKGGDCFKESDIKTGLIKTI